MRMGVTQPSRGMARLRLQSAQSELWAISSTNFLVYFQMGRRTKKVNAMAEFPLGGVLENSYVLKLRELLAELVEFYTHLRTTTELLGIGEPNGRRVVGVKEASVLVSASRRLRCAAAGLSSVLMARWDLGPDFDPRPSFDRALMKVLDSDIQILVNDVLRIVRPPQGQKQCWNAGDLIVSEDIGTLERLTARIEQTLSAMELVSRLKRHEEITTVQQLRGRGDPSPRSSP